MRLYKLTRAVLVYAAFQQLVVVDFLVTNMGDRRETDGIFVKLFPQGASTDTLAVFQASEFGD